MNRTYRKVISGLVLLIVGVVITLIKGDIPNNLNQLMGWLYTAFVAGNGVEHISNAFIATKQSNKEVK
jgi:hypothetical protein